MASGGAIQQNANYGTYAGFEKVLTRMSVVRCGNCGGEHSTRACPRLLDRPMKMVDSAMKMVDIQQVATCVTRLTTRITTTEFGFKQYQAELPYEPQDIVVPNQLTNSTIEVSGFRVSCSSDRYDASGDFAGVVIYSCGTHAAPPCSVRLKPGYVFFCRTDGEHKARLPPSREGMIHGRAVKQLFRTNSEPSILERDFNVVMVGFAIQQGKFKINSAALNCGRGAGWKDGSRELNNIEEYLLVEVSKKWIEGGPGSTLMVKDLWS